MCVTPLICVKPLKCVTSVRCDYIHEEELEKGKQFLRSKPVHLNFRVGPKDILQASEFAQT